MGWEITLAGLRLTYEEWHAFDAQGRADILRAVVREHDAALARDPVKSYARLAAVAAGG
jgi:hypothetical protein